MTYRKADIYVSELKAGILSETDFGYSFEYLKDYLDRKDASPVSLTLPLQSSAFEAKVFFPFFDGLIPEGWLLDVVEDTWKINAKDRFGLLLVSCKDTIGNVSVREHE